MQIWIVTIALLLSSWATAQYATDSCVVFEVDVPAVKMMGYMPANPEWTEINYVIHIHHTDSFPDSYLSETVIYDAHDHLNQELEEAMFSPTAGAGVSNVHTIQLYGMGKHEPICRGFSVGS
jgi:hypothetical protein